MIYVSSENAQKFEKIKRKGAAFLSNLFKLKKLALGMKIDADEKMERAPRIETPGEDNHQFFVLKGNFINFLRKLLRLFHIYKWEKFERTLNSFSVLKLKG